MVIEQGELQEKIQGYESIGDKQKFDFNNTLKQQKTENLNIIEVMESELSTIRHERDQLEN